MFYKLLGYIVWHAARFYARRRYGSLIPSRRATAAGFVGLAVLGMAVAAARRDTLDA